MNWFRRGRGARDVCAASTSRSRPGRLAPPSAPAEIGKYCALTSLACKQASEIYGARDVISDARTDAQARVQVLRPGTAVVAFRGTTSPRDWCHNWMIAQRRVPYQPDASVRAHTGFLLQYLSIHGEIVRTLGEHKVARVLLCGHSLGGALAVLAAIMLPAGVERDLVTFGAPRVGNRALAECAKRRCVRIVRVVHDRDVVPAVPPMLLGYAHVPGRWYFVNDSGAVAERDREPGVATRLWNRVVGVATLDFGVRDHCVSRYAAAVCDAPAEEYEPPRPSPDAALSEDAGAADAS